MSKPGVGVRWFCYQPISTLERRVAEHNEELRADLEPQD